MTRPSSPPAPAGDGFESRCGRLGPALMRALSLTDIQAAGLLGNLGHETGGFRHLQEIAPAAPGSRGGWGIAQWTGARRTAMEAWSRAQGLDPASEEANEGYLLFELRTDEVAALEALRRAATLEDATASFCRDFERPGISAMPDRLVWARRALRALRALRAPSASLSASPSEGRPAPPSRTPASGGEPRRRPARPRRSGAHPSALAKSTPARRPR